jgi:adenine-specific DNA-methyltransferase
MNMVGVAPPSGRGNGSMASDPAQARFCFAMHADCAPLRPQRRVGTYPSVRLLAAHPAAGSALSWINGVLHSLPFSSVADPFVGSGDVAYLLKTMGKRVVASDPRPLPCLLATALLENNAARLEADILAQLLLPTPQAPSLLASLPGCPEDRGLAERIAANANGLDDPFQSALARTALVLAIQATQGNGRTSAPALMEAFIIASGQVNRAVFDNGLRNTVRQADPCGLMPHRIDLVWLDLPRPAGLNHRLLAALSSLAGTASEQVAKPRTPTRITVLDRLLKLYRRSIIVLNCREGDRPGLVESEAMLQQVKRHVTRYARRPARGDAFSHWLLVGRD